jgi:hypothetical protein
MKKLPASSKRADGPRRRSRLHGRPPFRVISVTCPSPPISPKTAHRHDRIAQPTPRRDNPAVPSGLTIPARPGRLLRHLGLVAGTRQGKNTLYALYDNHVAALLDEAAYHSENLRLGLGLRDEVSQPESEAEVTAV